LADDTDKPWLARFPDLYKAYKNNIVDQIKKLPSHQTASLLHVAECLFPYVEAEIQCPRYNVYGRQSLDELKRLHSSSQFIECKDKNDWILSSIFVDAMHRIGASMPRLAMGDVTLDPVAATKNELCKSTLRIAEIKTTTTSTSSTTSTTTNNSSTSSDDCRLDAKHPILLRLPVMLPLLPLYFQKYIEPRLLKQHAKFYFDSTELRDFIQDLVSTQYRCSSYYNSLAHFSTTQLKEQMKKDVMCEMFPKKDDNTKRDKTEMLARLLFVSILATVFTQITFADSPKGGVVIQVNFDKLCRHSENLVVAVSTEKRQRYPDLAPIEENSVYFPPPSVSASSDAKQSNLPADPPSSKWSVAQLKMYLQQHNVDSSTCVDKAELVALAVQLAPVSSSSSLPTATSAASLSSTTTTMITSPITTQTTAGSPASSSSKHNNHHKSLFCIFIQCASRQTQLCDLWQIDKEPLRWVQKSCLLFA